MHMHATQDVVLSIKAMLYIYSAPAGIGLSYNGGATAGTLLVVQVISGIFIAMTYTAQDGYSYTLLDGGMLL